MMPRRIGLWLVLMLLATAAAAHEVQHHIEPSTAVAVRLQYADGKPFAFEAFEATPEGAEAPAQVGRTDAEGRAVFVPGTAKRWKLKAYSADGHGVDLNFDAPTIAANTSLSNAASSESPNRASLLLFGLSLLLAGFGGYQLWLRRKS